MLTLESGRKWGTNCSLFMVAWLEDKLSLKIHPLFIRIHHKRDGGGAGAGAGAGGQTRFFAMALAVG